MSWRKLLLLNVALLSLMILASRAAMLIHEVAGHGVPAWLLGAKSIRLELSILGGGLVHATGFPPGEPSGFGRFIFSLGGIGLNLITGAAAWFLARRVVKSRGLPHLFLLLLGAGSFGQAIYYLGNGFYYSEGDPTGFAANGDLRPLQPVWLVFVPAMGVVAGFAAKAYLDFLSAHAPIDTPRRRIGWTSATVIAVAVIYVGLWAATWRQGVDVTLRDQRIQQEIRREMAKRPPPPPAPPRPPTVQPPPNPAVPAEVIQVAKQNTPAPVSGLALLGAAAIGALIALLKSKPTPEPGEISGRGVAICTALAGAAVLVIALA